MVEDPNIMVWPNPDETTVPSEEIEEIILIRDYIEEMDVPDGEFASFLKARHLQLYFEISSQIQNKIKEERLRGNYEEADRISACALMIIQFRACKRAAMEFGLIDPETEEPFFI